MLGALSPFFQTGSFLNNTFGTIPRFFGDRSEIIAENERLALELERLQAEILDYEFLKIENQQLRESLGFLSGQDFFGVKIVARPPQIALDTLLIDEGSGNGLNEGSLIFGSEKTLVGQVVRISGGKSVVALSSFPDKSLFGYIARTDEILEIKGIGGGSLEARVPIDFDVIINDKIIYEGSGDVIMAVVRSIEEDTSSGFKKILLSLPVDISKIHILFAKKPI